MILDSSGNSISTSASVTSSAPALDQPAARLYGDLTTKPPADKRLVIQDLVALDYCLHHPSTSTATKAIIERIRDERKDMLIAELAQAPMRLNQRVQTEVHHQLRVRQDFQTDQLAGEQWVPALGYWIVTGYFPLDVEYDEVILQFQKGDPRFQTPYERLNARRTQAKVNRAALDSAHSDKIRGVVDNMSVTQRDRFLEVEHAIKAGDTLVAKGDDLSFVESAFDKTKKAAEQGDTQAQVVLSDGVKDNLDCFNPQHNPVRR